MQSEQQGVSWQDLGRAPDLYRSYSRSAATNCLAPAPICTRRMNKIKCPAPVLSAPTLSRNPGPPTGPPTASPPPFAGAAPTAPVPGMPPTAPPPVGMPLHAGMPPFNSHGVSLHMTASATTALIHGVTVTAGAA